MAEISEIIAKEAIEGILKADRALTSLDTTIQKIITQSQQLNGAMGGNSFREYESVTKRVKVAADNLNQAQKQRIQVEKELQREQKKATDQQAKLAAKEKERADAIKLTVRSIQDAERQNKALRETVKQLDLTTKQGRDTLRQYNQTIDQNTKFIRENSDADKQRQAGIGKYTQAILKAGAALGLTVGAAQAFNAAIKATDTVSDAFDQTVGGLRSGLHYFAVALTELDFSNFLTNMKEAVRAGKEYVNTLQDIEDRTRAGGVIAAEDRKRIAELDVISKDVNKTIEQRKAALDEIFKLETKNTQINLQNAKDTEAAKLKFVADQTGLTEERVKSLVKEFELNKGNVEQARQFLAATEKIADASFDTNPLSKLLFGDNGKKEANQTIQNTPENIRKYAVEISQLGRVSGDVLNDLSNSMIAVSEADAAFLEQNQKRLTRYNKLQDQQNEGNQTHISNVEREKTAIEKLTDKITALRSELENALFTTGEAPDGLIRQLLGSEAELKRVQDQVKSLTGDIVDLASKGIQPLTGGSTGGNTGLLTPRAPGATGAPTGQAGGLLSGITSAEWKDMAISAASQTSDEIFNIIGQKDQEAFDKKMNLLEKEKQAKLSNANLTEKQKAKIEADYEKKAAKVKEEAFKKKKAADFIQSLINTALAVTNALASGGPAAPALAIAAGITGAIQSAFIAAQPVPQFDAGTGYTPKNFIAGERRPEWMKTASGQWRYVDRPTMFKNMAGATVIGGAQTERLMKAGIHPANDIRPEINAMRTDIVEAIKGKKELSITASGSKITQREGNYNKQYFNRFVQWAGKN